MIHAPDSIKGLILKYLNDETAFKFGGVIEHHIRAKAGPKASNVSRRLRELHQEGLIERRLVQVKAERGNKLVVQYKWKDLTEVSEAVYPQAKPAPARVDNSTKTQAVLF